MPADRHEVDVHLVNVHWDFADTLGSVGMEKDLVFAAYLSYLLYGLNHSDLIVTVDKTRHERIRSNRSLKLLKIYKPTCLLDWEIGDVESLLLEMSTRVEYALVLNLRGDNVPLLVAVEGGSTLDAQVVGFCGPAGEDYFLGLGADKLGDF